MNKRKRFVRPVRDVPLSDEEMADFCKRLKKGLLEEYKAKLSFYHMLIGEIHSGIDGKIKNFKGNIEGSEKQQERYFFTAHSIISRSGLIESVTRLCGFQYESGSQTRGKQGWIHGALQKSGSYG